MRSRWKKKRNQRHLGTASGRHYYRRQLFLEQLEDRRLLATVTVVVHGAAFLPTSGPLKDMGNAIYSYFNSDNVDGSAGLLYHDPTSASLSLHKGINNADNRIVVFDWEDESNDFDPRWDEAASDALFALLVDKQLASSDYLHLIGHSRGAIVVSEATQRLLNHGFGVDHVTLLDHEKCDGTDMASAGDPYAWKGVGFVDNYYGTGTSEPVCDGPLKGEPVNGAYNVNLATQSNIVPDPDPDGNDKVSHKRVRTWYEESITNSNANNGFYWRRSQDQQPETQSGRTTLAMTPLLFNGNFTYSDVVSNELPGWERQGGGGTGHPDNNSNPYLELDFGSEDYTRTHNPLYFPQTVRDMKFDVWISNKSSNGDALQLYVGETSEGSPLVLDHTTNGFIIEQSIDVSAYAGDVKTITLRIDPVGGVDSEVRIDNVVLLSGPVADAGGNYDTIPNTAIQLDASASYDVDGSISSYKWDFDDDGNYDDANGKLVNFEKSQSGNYPVSLKVTDSNSYSDYDSVTVKVTDGGSETGIIAGRDAYVNKESPNTNYGSTTVLKGIGGKTYTYVWFDFEDKVPDGATVKSAQISLSPKTVNNQTIYLYRIKNGNWTESNITWNNKPSPRNSNSAEYFANNATEPIEFDVTYEIQGIVLGNLENYGYMIVPFDGNEIEMRSREYSDSTAPKLEISFTVLPESTIEPVDPVVNGASNLKFTVNYSDNVSVDASDIGTGNVVVTGPNNFNEMATFVSKIPHGGDKPLISATYSIPAPGGSWDPTDNGDYTITMNGEQVSDVEYDDNWVIPGDLATFPVDLSTKPNTPNGDLPKDGVTVDSLTPTLYASDFSDPETSDTHKATQWLVATTRDFNTNSIVWDFIDNDDDKTSEQVPTDILTYDTQYYWKMLYQDNNDVWSDPSADDRDFTTPVDNHVPTGSVTISGSAVKGQTLTASNNLADEDGLGTISYQWNRESSITAWGSSYAGGSGAPTDSGYTQIFSTDSAFAALKANGSITAWGGSNYGGSGAPTDSGYTQIFSNYYAFAALKADGSITAWGSYGFSGAPTDSG
jgi:hypothetical protein